MHATVRTFRRPPDRQDVLVPPPTDADRPSGSLVVDHLSGGEITVVAFWPEGRAPAAAAPYRVTDRLSGAAAGRRPLFAQLTWLNAVGDPAVAAAAERGGRERIHPAIRDVDGLVEVLVLRSADHRIVVVGLTTGLETQAEIRDRIAATRLLPGEDPALLPGPDRSEQGRVLVVELPAEVLT